MPKVILKLCLLIKNALLMFSEGFGKENKKKAAAAALP